MLGCACLTKNCCRSHTQGGQQFGWVCMTAESLICVPWVFPGGYTKTGNTSAWEFRIYICPMPPHCIISALLLYFLSFSVIPASPSSIFLISPQGKALTSSCTLHIFLYEPKPTSQLRQSHLSWLSSRLSAEPQDWKIPFHQEGTALVSRNQTLFHISNCQVWFGKEAIQ